jgi:hypothetical protein
MPRPRTGRGFSCPMAGHNRGCGSPDIGCPIHKLHGDTSKISLHIPPSEGWQLPRERRAVEAADTAVGRFFAPHTPKMPINRAFLIRRPWNFDKKRPKLPPQSVAIRDPKRKNGANCHTLMGDCLPFWVKNEKVCRQCNHIGKNFYLCSELVSTRLLFYKSQIPCM